MLTEDSIIDKIEILEDGQIQVRRANRVLRDGVVIANTYHRHVLAPGDSLDKQDDRVAAVAKTVWTDDVIGVYQKQQAQQASLSPLKGLV